MIVATQNDTSIKLWEGKQAALSAVVGTPKELNRLKVVQNRSHAELIAEAQLVEFNN
jgi:hypothetical protein